MPDADEDHLGVALIQPGSSRYEQMSGSYFEKMIRNNCNQGGTACDTSLARLLQGTFYFVTIQESATDANLRMEALNSLENNKKENGNG